MTGEYVVSQFLARLDLDHSGELSREELAQIRVIVREAVAARAEEAGWKPAPPERAKHLVDRFLARKDTDKNGSLSRIELSAPLASRPEGQEEEAQAYASTGIGVDFGDGSGFYIGTNGIAVTYGGTTVGFKDGEAILDDASGDDGGDTGGGG